MSTPVLDLFRPLAHALARGYFGLDLHGVENIPTTGPVLITPNHQTYADPPLVSLPVRRPVHYMAWSRLFQVPVFGQVIRLLRAFPVDIDSTDSRATREAVRLLQAGAAVMIFPEGGRSLDGRIGRFRAGAFRLAVAVRAPVLPVTIVGGHQAWPPQRLLPRRARIAITYHPLQWSDPSLGPREAARQLAARTQQAIISALEHPGGAGADAQSRGRSTTR
ncbi:MAG TPA: lysophospholipid acyltransferase family protein [Methylomirabilota bacterium]|nr:lysophospholipid acyltransferase family protein [Methylomirabilota bacterium]